MVPRIKWSRQWMIKLVGHLNHCQSFVMCKGANVPKVDGNCSSSCRILQCTQIHALCRLATHALLALHTHLVWRAFQCVHKLLMCCLTDIILALHSHRAYLSVLLQWRWYKLTQCKINTSWQTKHTFHKAPNTVQHCWFNHNCTRYNCYDTQSQCSSFERGRRRSSEEAHKRTTSGEAYRGSFDGLEGRLSPPGDRFRSRRDTRRTCSTLGGLCLK